MADKSSRPGNPGNYGRSRRRNLAPTAPERNEKSENMGGQQKSGNDAAEDVQQPPTAPSRGRGKGRGRGAQALAPNPANEQGDASRGSSPERPGTSMATSATEAQWRTVDRGRSKRRLNPEAPCFPGPKPGGAASGAWANGAEVEASQKACQAASVNQGAGDSWPSLRGSGQPRDTRTYPQQSTGAVPRTQAQPIPGSSQQQAWGTQVQPIPGPSQQQACGTQVQPIPGPSQQQAWGTQVRPIPGPSQQQACGTQVQPIHGPSQQQACGTQVQPIPGPSQQQAWGTQVQPIPGPSQQQACGIQVQPIPVQSQQQACGTQVQPIPGPSQQQAWGTQVQPIPGPSQQQACRIQVQPIPGQSQQQACGTQVRPPRAECQPQSTATVPQGAWRQPAKLLTSPGTSTGVQNQPWSQVHLQPSSVKTPNSGVQTMQEGMKSLAIGRKPGRANDWLPVTREVALKYFAEHSNTSGGKDDGYKGKGGNPSAGKKRRPKDRDPDEIEVEEIIWTRPKELPSKKGAYGTEIALTSNYFRLITQTNWCLYQYRVDFSPEEERTVIKRKIMHSFEDKLGEGYIFDGTVLFSMNRLSEPMELYCLRPNSDKCYRITLRLVGDMAPGDHHYLQFYNLLVRRCLGHLNLQLVGRNYFDPAAAVTSMKDEYKMQLWPGYITSIRQHEQEVMMCAEITHKVMRRDTVLDQLTEIYSRNKADYQRVFKLHILGTIVLTEYNNKTYRVDDVDFNTTPLSTFSMKDRAISYVEYYRQRYDITIKQKNQPMLLTMPKQRDQRRGIKQPIYLVPELCRMTGLNENMRKNFPLMKCLADQTRLGPSERIQRLIQFAKRLQGEAKAKADLDRWNMKFSTGLVKFNGRVLTQEKICQGNRCGKEVNYASGKNSDWTRDLRSNPMLVVGPMKFWVLVSPANLMREAKTFVQNVQTVSVGMGLRLPQPMEVSLEDDRLTTYIQAISRFCAPENRPSLMMIILPNNRLDRYAAIKKKCCVDSAVPTQLILAKNLSNNSVMSIATKVAVQMNCKIGGAPWTVEIPLEGLMVIGFDVYHDTSQKGTSIGALVSSLDKQLSRYYSSVSFHRTGEELSNELPINVIKALHKYRNYNGGNLPRKIVLYRDGVGEGQITYVFQHEVELLKQRLTEIYKGNHFHLAFIVITKRINTRFFAEGGNPPSGTVVDDVITLPHRYDFFLVSQSVKQGTVSPTSYNVIFDNLGLTPDKLQRLTFKLTHLYFNWSGTVRVPAPCQYAHKLAYLVGQAIHKSPNPDLDELLYFL
ncbi:piwi-like protein Siwi isoform X2 [Ischnura elegans]|uniref:piwi-like protein Siwi isoform X2 n=1 Tax=Ischnura elegans TaxID=197161 RepID=UPI001ED8876B|nr:piwi-like protein Siwi isoform X2 [Ischnura elegans]